MNESIIERLKKANAERALAQEKLAKIKERIVQEKLAKLKESENRKRGSDI